MLDDVTLKVVVRVSGLISTRGAPSHNVYVLTLVGYMVSSQDVSVTPQIIVCVVSTVLENLVLATYLFHQLMLESRQSTISDQHFSTSGIELDQLMDAVGRKVLDLKISQSLFASEVPT